MNVHRPDSAAADFTPSTPHPPVIVPVERLSAAVKGIWRLLAASVVLGAAYLVFYLVGNWELLWQSHAMTFVALAALNAVAAIVGLAIFATGSQWLLLAIWPAHLFIRIDVQAIHAALGPFGTDTTRWSDLHCDVAEGFDADMIAQLPDDALTPVLRNRLSGVDIFGRLLSRSGVTAEALTHALRPFLKLS